MILLEIGLLDLSGSSFMLTDTSDGYFVWKNCDFSYETGRCGSALANCFNSCSACLSITKILSLLSFLPRLNDFFYSELFLETLDFIDLPDALPGIIDGDASSTSLT